MNRLTNYIKNELDVEFFCCVHAMSMVFVYGFLEYLHGVHTVKYVIIIEMMLISYLFTWIQKALFLKEKLYSKVEYMVRVFIWNVAPLVSAFLGGRILGWYEGSPAWVEPWFLLIMLSYYIIVWIFLQKFYRTETKQLNDMLSEFKSRKKQNN